MFLSFQNASTWGGGGYGGLRDVFSRHPGCGAYLTLGHLYGFKGGGVTRTGRRAMAGQWGLLTISKSLHSRFRCKLDFRKKAIHPPEG